MIGPYKIARLIFDLSKTYLFSVLCKLHTQAATSSGLTYVSIQVTNEEQKCKHYH